MQQINCHITIKGAPLCQCEGHHSGLINTLDVSCGYWSLAAARRAWRKIVKHHYWKEVRIVRGNCPDDET